MGRRSVCDIIVNVCRHYNRWKRFAWKEISENVLRREKESTVTLIADDSREERPPREKKDSEKLRGN